MRLKHNDSVGTGIKAKMVIFSILIIRNVYSHTSAYAEGPIGNRDLNLYKDLLCYPENLCYTRHRFDYAYF